MKQPPTQRLQQTIKLIAPNQINRIREQQAYANNHAKSVVVQITRLQQSEQCRKSSGDFPTAVDDQSVDECLIAAFPQAATEKACTASKNDFIETIHIVFVIEQ